MDPFTSAMVLTSAGLGALAVALLAGGLYGTFLESFVTEVQQESEGGVQGAGAVVVRRLGAINRRYMSPGYEERTRLRLTKAGQPQGYRPEDIMALQEIGAVVGLIMGIIISQGADLYVGWSFAGVALGVFYPFIWLNDLVTKRHLQISRAMPFSLDLLTLAVEAGLDFTAALDTVVRRSKPGPLREELALALKQLKMGKSREEALKAMIARVELPALSQFVTAIIQADRMGTSVGKVLRIQSTQLRIERTQRAEKLAGEAPVKMLGPLIMCIFPTIFAVIFGPIIFAFKFGNVGM